MPPPELPVLSEVLCVGCADCVGCCPTDCLAMAGPLPWLVRPADCISCSLCVLVCPAGALTLAAPEGEEPDSRSGGSCPG
jgi:formate hydrogenlyase subunit 6/NADH:ubiquinone oxidoreductase subunit I